jgi:hypothetical protein
MQIKDRRPSADCERVLSESKTSAVAMRLVEGLPTQPIVTAASVMRTLDPTKSMASLISSPEQ